SHERQPARPQSRGGDDGGAEDRAARPACQRSARVAQLDEEDAADRGVWRQARRRRALPRPAARRGRVAAINRRRPRRRSDPPGGADCYTQPLSSRSAICQITAVVETAPWGGQTRTLADTRSA